MQRKNGLALKEEMSPTAGRALTLAGGKDLKAAACKVGDLTALVSECKTAVSQLDFVYTRRTCLLIVIHSHLCLM